MATFVRLFVIKRLRCFKYDKELLCVANHCRNFHKEFRENFACDGVIEISVLAISLHLFL